MKIRVYVMRLFMCIFISVCIGCAVIQTISEGNYTMVFVTGVLTILFILVWIMLDVALSVYISDMNIFDEYVEFTLQNKKKRRVDKADITKIYFRDGTYRFYLTNKEILYFVIEIPTVAVFGDGKKRLKEINEYNFPYSKLNV